MKIQMKLNKRIFAVEISDDLMNIDEIRNETIKKILTQIRNNNETIENVFFDELEIVCSECGISLECGEEEEATKCLQCENANLLKHRNEVLK